MKENQEKVKNSTGILLILLFITVMLFLDSKIIISAMIDIIYLFMYNVLPALFPFFVLSDLLINYNFVYYLNKILNKPLNTLFHIDGNSSFVILMSLISGFPSGAKYTKSLLEKKLIDENTANYLITFTHFSNPLFVFGTVFLFLNDLRLTILIFICHVLANFLVAFVIRPKHKIMKKSENKKVIPSPFIISLSNSIYSSFKILLLIIGNSMFASMITSIIIKHLDLGVIYNSFIYGFFDITKGINAVSILTLSTLIKGILVVSFLSFGGISVHMQVSSIISNSKIKYRNFLFGRFCQVGVSILLFLLSFHFFI